MFLVNGGNETGVSQGSILAQFSFNTLCFWLVFNSWQHLLCNLITPLTPSTEIQTLWLFEEPSIPLLSWFKEYRPTLNLDKCHLIVSGTEDIKIKLDDFTIANSEKEKLLSIIFDDRLKFQYLIENLCKKVSLKLSALSRVAPFVDLAQRKFYSTSFSVTV